MFVYRLNILSELKKRGFSEAFLKRRGVLGSADCQKIRTGQVIGINTLHKLCILLDCQPGSLIEYKPDQDSRRDVFGKLYDL